MANKQTAVEWLQSQYRKYGAITPTDFKQAKAVEKEQIEDAFEYGWSARNADSMKYGKQYYNEIFKSE